MGDTLETHGPFCERTWYFCVFFFVFVCSLEAVMGSFVPKEIGLEFVNYLRLVQQEMRRRCCENEDTASGGE